MGGSGSFVITVTSPSNNKNTLQAIIGAASPLEKTTESTFDVPDSVLVVSSELLSDIATENSSVTTITLGSSVVEVEAGALSWSNLECINVDENSSGFTVKDCVLFTKDMRSLVTYPPAKKGDFYERPNETEAILSGAFTRSSLTSVTLPSAPKTIEEGAFTESP